MEIFVKVLVFHFSKCFELIPRVDSITFRFCLGIKENNQKGDFKVFDLSLGKWYYHLMS